jgi:hypothetical protein
MKIVAQTNEGFLINATEHEIKALLTSFGVKDPKPQIGIEIPAADFSRSINVIKTFAGSYDYKHLKEAVAGLQNAVKDVDNQLELVSRV